MFRKFRNKVLAIYLISILILLVGSLSFVYIRSYTEMNASISQRLNDKREKPKGEQPGEMPSGLNTDFNFDEARDLVIYKDEDFEQKLDEYLTLDYQIDYTKQLITTAEDTYAFGMNNDGYKVVKITYDLQYIESLKSTLFIYGTIVMAIFSAGGYLLITKLVRPLEAAYETQNRFVSDASHELKTPLAIIKSCVQLIASGDDDQENLIVYVQDETDRLIRLTDNLLQLSEIDQEDYPEIDVTNTLELLISGIEVNLFEKKIKLESQIDTNIKARVASDDLNQLAHILIDNAVKYNDNRRIVKVKLTVHNRMLVLTVANSSDYVNNQDIGHLFDRFYRASASRQEKGFGLGLALAKHITNKYNGDIKAEYEGGYFTIIVRLPIK
ncbi:HAMP domain-containing sensor histidine kinase [Mollicutes bacterium LVI A0039]|nr:HAMP domain-containing sensor histidine kinase [Mollicutes bacterium LVI A0039]